MKLTVLGTGNAMVTKVYNTCFALTQGDQTLLVDAGGGNEILKRLPQAGITPDSLEAVFVTHKHIDHLLGVMWVIRLLCQTAMKGNLHHEVTLYAHEEVIGLLTTMCQALLTGKQAAVIGKQLHFVTVCDGESRQVLGQTITFFNIHSTKAKQFGFTITLPEGGKLTCCGDEPYNPAEEPYAKAAKWLLHEAFCLAEDADRFKPYEKHHSTAADASQLAETLQVENLLLYHTEDKTIDTRKVRYTAEAKAHFGGKVWVPEDMETFEL